MAPEGKLLPKLNRGRGVPAVNVHSSDTPVPMTTGWRLLLPLIVTIGDIPAQIENGSTSIYTGHKLQRFKKKFFMGQSLFHGVSYLLYYIQQHVYSL